MGSQKHGMRSSSETSSDEESSRRRYDSADGGSKDGLGRSYECSFCKRGFTNAQALGGHMNIHRKDKLAKAKNHHHHHASSSSSSPNNPNKHHHSSESFNLINPNQHPAAAAASSNFGFHTSRSGRSDDHHQLSNPSRNFQWNLAAAHINQDEDNLNLRIGGTSDGIIGNTNNLGFTKIGQEDWRYENDIDLELRLGHYP